MRMSAQEFLDWDAKSITLLAMSGAGKTTLSNKLPKDKWFHYSGDYRIGTKYLGEPILDDIKRQAMSVPLLKDLLLSDSIYIANNMTVDNLAPVSKYLGKIGSAALGGLSLAEFKKRQALHHKAEVAAMLDVGEFMEKAEHIYGYKYFINDAGGSVCELENDEVMGYLAEKSLILYIKTSEEHNELIMNRAKAAPKPLYYREEFLDQQLAEFMRLKHYRDIDEIIPDEFVCWVFPALFKSRLPRYEKVVEQYGYVLDANEVAAVNDEHDFIHLIAQAIAAQTL